MTELLGFARALRNHDRLADVVGEHGKNSHMPTTAIYERMIERWRELGEPTYPYDKKTIEEILAARIHPSSRK